MLEDNWYEVCVVNNISGESFVLSRIISISEERVLKQTNSKLIKDLSPASLIIFNSQSKLVASKMKPFDFLGFDLSTEKGLSEFVRPNLD